MKFRFLFLMGVLLCFNHSGFAQGAKELLCRVMDSEGKYPVSYATIRIKDSGKGVIANVNGDFRIPFKYKQNRGSLEISCIGYETKLIAAESLNEKKINIIFLRPKVEPLSEVVIKNKKRSKYMPADEIVKKAIANIPVNYANVPFSEISYYREYQVVDDTYYNLNEALLESFDLGFSSDVIMDNYNETAIFKYQENENFLKDSILLKAYDGQTKFIKNTDLSGQGGNELGILNIHNPIRNFEQLSFSFIYVFKKKFVPNHTFKLLRKMYLDDELLYEIAFQAKKDVTGVSHKASGKIYISKENFAIHKLVYNVHEIKNNQPLFGVTVEYKSKGEKMYLNYITFNNRFEVKSNFFFDVSKIVYDQNERSFYVTFNNKVLESSLNRRDFVFKYGKNKLVVKKIALIDDYVVKVTMEDWSLHEDLKKENPDMKWMKYKFKNIYDIANRKIYKAPHIKGYQFRELFVQEVKENHQKPRDLKFINKYKPISQAPINFDKSKDSYWLNTPLKAID